ncbi:MAG: peptidoglycan DD-metalloendopeptidase family protein [Hyphomicrobiaceae bacterium]|nr:peptidoglycan DD-metalloendopeptidase family protein [Hyphomicrobiaceae bacterium]
MTEAVRQTAGASEGALARKRTGLLAGFGAAAVLLLVVMTVPGFAQQPAASTAEEAKKRREDEKTKLEQTQRLKKELQSDVEKIAAERERINARLVETGKLIQQSEGRLSHIEASLSELEQQEQTLRTQLVAKHGSISGLLAALQRMGRNPPPVMITQRHDALTMVRSAMLLSSAFPQLRQEAVALDTQLEDLVRVMQGIRSESEKLKAEKARYDEARTRLAMQQEIKRQSQAEREAELAKMGTLANQISRNVQDLSELIASLDKEVANRTGLGAYEQEVAAQPPAPAPGQAPPGPVPPGKGPAPGAKADAKAPPAGAVLAPSGDRVAMLAPGRIKPAMPFENTRGMLPLPAFGRRVLSFGDKTQFGSQSKGLVLQTRQGAQVVSPSDGWVVYAGDFRSYGQLLIINAGGGYHILLAGLSQIDVQLGQFVLTGEPVGVMPSSGTSAKQQGSAPVLYVEFRKDQKPVNPDPWWVPASRKVR